MVFDNATSSPQRVTLGGSGIAGKVSAGSAEIVGLPADGVV